MSTENGVIFFCPNCHKTFGGDRGSKYNVCSNCKADLVETMVPIQAWREMPDEQKENLKRGWIFEQQKQTKSLVPVNTSEVYLQQIAHDIHFLYIIALILVILFVIGFVISLLTVGIGAFSLFKMF